MNLKLGITAGLAALTLAALAAPKPASAAVFGKPAAAVSSTVRDNDDYGGWNRDRQNQDRRDDRDRNFDRDNRDRRNFDRDNRDYGRGWGDPHVVYGRDDRYYCPPPPQRHVQYFLGIRF